MEEKYVSYSQAVKLKELGFDWDCTHYYNDNDNNPKHPYEVEPRCFGMYHISYDFNYDDSNELFEELTSAPRLDQAQKWLRDTKELHVLPRLENVNKPDYVCIVTLMRKEIIRITNNGSYFPNYELALSAGIDAALELLTLNTK